MHAGAQEGDATSSASKESTAAPATAAATPASAAKTTASKVPAITWIHKVDDFITADDRTRGIVPADGDAGRVGFSHSVHASANVSCETCHHTGLTGYVAQACATCHEGTAAISVMHGTCIDCHVNRTIGPVSCNECHTGRQVSASGIFRFELYDLVKGPLFIAAWILFVVGLAWRVWRFIRLTRAAQPAVLPVAAGSSDADRAFLERGASTGLGRFLRRLRTWERGTVFSTNPVMSRVSVVFHVLLFAVPLLLPAHNILFYGSFRLALPSLPEPVMDVLTLVLLVFGAFFLVRRIIVPRVRALTTLRDYLVLLLVAAPFVTAYMAYHHWLDYRTVLVTHMLIGDIVIAAIPFTKLGHMPFLILARFFAGGEYAWKPGNRRW
jgi:nitrate reductase gamma subunit